MSQVSKQDAARDKTHENAGQILFTGIDVGENSENAEVIARRNSDGTITVLEINQWKHDIDLEVER